MSEIEADYWWAMLLWRGKIRQLQKDLIEVEAAIREVQRDIERLEAQRGPEEEVS